MGGVEGAAALCAAASAAAQAVGSETARKLSAAFMVDALADGFLEDILPAHWVAAMARAPAEAVQALAVGDAAGGLWPEDLARFVGLCHAGSLAREASVGRGAGAREVRGVLRRGCKPKKLHEIARLADAVAEAAQRTGASTVVDFGSGAGYLGNVLAAEDGFDVVGVECEAHLNAKAERRGSAAVQWAARQRERGAKASLAAPAPAAAAGKDSDSAAAERQPPAHGPEGPPPGGSVAAVTALVGSGEDLDAVVAGCRDAVLTGLHTCGDLHASLLRIFLESSARGLVSVGCCYHRRTDVGEGQQPLRVFPLSRHVAALNVDLSSNELELACHTAEDFAARPATDLWASTHRAMLQLLLRQKLSEDRWRKLKIGRLRLKRHERPGAAATFESFYSFVCGVWRLSRLGDGPMGVACPSEAEAQLVYTAHQGRHLALVGARALRQLVGAALETLIQCDRALFLADGMPASATRHVAVAPLFDPRISPRTFAITAFK